MARAEMIESGSVEMRGDMLRRVSIGLVMIGLVITTYLSYVKLTDVPMQCVVDSVFNCEVVQNSIYSRLFGIPIAWLGLATYIVLGVVLGLENRAGFLKAYGVMLIFGITLFAWLYSMYLVYLQFVVIQALCPWCLAHEATMTALFAVSSLRMWRSMG